MKSKVFNYNNVRNGIYKIWNSYIFSFDSWVLKNVKILVLKEKKKKDKGDYVGPNYRFQLNLWLETCGPYFVELIMALCV